MLVHMHETVSDLVQTIRSSDEHMNKYALVEAVVTQLAGCVTNGFII